MVKNSNRMMLVFAADENINILRTSAEMLFLAGNEVAVAICAEVMHMLHVSSPKYRAESQKNM
jgi:hypothetical protein